MFIKKDGVIFRVKKRLVEDFNPSCNCPFLIKKEMELILFLKKCIKVGRILPHKEFTPRFLPKDTKINEEYIKTLRHSHIFSCIYKMY